MTATTRRLESYRREESRRTEALRYHLRTRHAWGTAHRTRDIQHEVLVLRALREAIAVRQADLEHRMRAAEELAAPLRAAWFEKSGLGGNG